MGSANSVSIVDLPVLPGGGREPVLTPQTRSLMGEAELTDETAI